MEEKAVIIKDLNKAYSGCVKKVKKKTYIVFWRSMKNSDLEFIL